MIILLAIATQAPPWEPTAKNTAVTLSFGLALLGSFLLVLWVAKLVRSARD
jgi:hypothetical protein